MANVKNKKLTPVEEQMLKTGKEIVEYKKVCEANVVAILWNNPELFYDYDNLSSNDFSDNCWRVFFVIGSEIIGKEKKKVLNDITVNFYLKEHPKLAKAYEEYGGWDTINNAKAYIDEENLEGYLKQLHKWKAVGQLLKMGFPIHNRLKDFIDMDLDGIYEEYEGLLNHAFTNVESEDKVYDLTDNLYDLIDEMDEGLNVGLPFDKLDMLTEQTGGLLFGNTFLIAGGTGAGKSSTTRNIIIPSILKQEESALFLINEEDEKKVSSEVMLYVANNIFLKNSNETLKKYVLRNGRYSPEVKSLLRKSADWMEQHKNKIKIIPFQKYTTKKAIKYIKKYAALGFGYFIIDTFKRDFSESISAEDHKVLAKSMSDLYDTIKPSAKNVSLCVCAQLTKSSDRQKFLGLSDLGISKNLQDTISTVIMIRRLHSDEFPNEKKELHVFKNESKSKIPVKLDPNKQYMVIFLPKNRFGSTEIQIVIEHCLSTNVYKEVGYCNIQRDY